ncbi:MAG: hypothetical protein ICV62_14350 [Cyanobacteria bacterium Co-bin13]|nr:hypothetical protein [Cyanobacteria bacterium Co-bin13]
MFLSADTLPQDRQQCNRAIKRVGVLYWQRLCQVGIPRGDARKIAAAIAKFDVARRPPAPEQAQLIERYSSLVCRAQLWRRDLLQWHAQVQISKQGS